MNTLLVLPLLIPLVTAAASLAAWRLPRIQEYVCLGGAAGLLAASAVLLWQVHLAGVLAVQAGGWPAPFGITLVADLFAAMMVVIAALIGLAGIVFSVGSVDDERKAFGYYPLLNVMLAGICLAFLTGDLFNLFVAFEMLLVSSFVLLALGGERKQLEGAIKYVTLNLLSSFLFLSGVGILYGIMGTLNMADLALKLPDVESKGLVTSAALMLMVAFGIKSAVFPLFFWLPDSYHTPPVAISAIFAGLLTKVGVYALIRTFTLIFVDDVDFTHSLLLVVSGLTMATGVLGAAAQNEMRRILSFHIVSQIGYMVMGLALFGPLAVAGSIFYVIHHILVKSNLFLVSGLVHQVHGSFELDRLGGLYRSRPLIAALFLIPAFSLAGLPPLSGFFAKLFLVRAAMDLESYWIIAVAMAVGLLTLYSMTKIWAAAFWKPLPADAPIEERGGAERRVGSPTEGRRANGGRKPGPTTRRNRALMLAPVVCLAAFTVTIGLFPSGLFSLSERAASQLLDRGAYVEAVLGKGPGARAEAFP